MKMNKNHSILGIVMLLAFMLISRSVEVSGNEQAAMLAGTLSAHWWSSPLRVIQPNLPWTEGALSGAAIAAEAQEYGANVVLLNAGGIYAFYPTEVPFHRRSPALKGDLFGDAARYCHEHGMRIVARFDLSGLQREAFEAHPEWFYQSADGRPMVDKGLYITCPNGGWHQDQFFRLWDELTARYQVDGLFFNMWGFREGDREGNIYGPCWCPNCRAKFWDRHVPGLPVARRGEALSSPALRAAYAAFRRESLRDLSRKVYTYVKERNPQVAFFAGPGAQAMLAGWTDVSNVELHASPGTGQRMAPWRFAPGESCRWVASLGSGFASGIERCIARSVRAGGG